MKLFLGTIPILLYMHLVFRILFPSGWDSVDSLLAFVALLGFFTMVPVLLMYPCYLERFTGERHVFLVLLISIISLIWAPANGLRLADLRSLLEQPLVVESGALYFISFNLLYSHVFQLYEKSSFYTWLKMKERLFFNDPPAHIRDFDKTASIYIGTILVVISLMAYAVFNGWAYRDFIKRRSAPAQVSRIMVPQPMPMHSCPSCDPVENKLFS